MKKYIFLLFISLITNFFYAQDRIVISTNSTQIVLSANKENDLKFEYYGKKINNIDNLFAAQANINVDAFPAFGIQPDKQIAIRVKHYNDDLTLVLKYQSHNKDIIDNNVEITTVHLKDDKYPFFVDLKYKVFKNENVIEVWNEVFHKEKKEVILYNYASSYLSFNAPKAFVTHFHGNFGTEFTQQESEIKDGKFVIENREGIRNSTEDNASFLLSLKSRPSEDEGEVIAGSLAWTGNYKISFSRDMFKQLHLTAGINNYASEYFLDKNKIFTTPALILTYSNKGKGEASRNLHRYARNYKMVEGNKPLKILLNSWEGVYFNISEDKIVNLIDDSAKIGVELFVMDDGWFGNKYSRDNGNQGLGDWQTSQKKLPNGIENLIDQAELRGIKFGIWVEPEMVNTKSELYEKHPDWILQNADRELVKGRGGTQVVLDLTNPKVQDFVFSVVDNLLLKHPRIDYIKWDANSSLANYGSTYLPKEKQSQLYVDFHLGLQKVFKRLRAKYLNITMEACASGGGRANYGYLEYFNEFWTSDNTDALQRIYSQWGMSNIFPANSIASHVSKIPNHQTRRVIPLKFRFDVSMTGKLGIDLLPKDLTDEETKFTKSAIETYKQIRPIIQFGDLYRIISPYKNKKLSSLIYVDELKHNAIYFGFCSRKILREKIPLFKLKGLNPDENYLIVEINKDGNNHFRGNNKTYKGSFLMDVGLNLNLQNEFDSVMLQITKSNN